MRKRWTVSDKGWKLPRYKNDWHNICAIMPKYLADGTNGTIIYYTDGSVEEVGHRLMWVLDDLLGYLDTSRALLQKKSLQWLNDGKLKRLPLIVQADFCLVPVKGRTGSSDKLIGYIVLDYVQAVQTVDGETLIHLQQDNTIVVLDSARTVQQNLVLARALSQCKQPK